MTELRESGQEFHDWTLALSQSHWAGLRAKGLPADVLKRFENEAAESIRRQTELEADDGESFEEYVARFHAALEVPDNEEP